MTKNEMTIAEMHEKMKLMGFYVPLENFVKLKPTEVKKLFKKAEKAFNLSCAVENALDELTAKNSAPIPRD